MSTSKKTLNEVRDILRKLDRSIDAARERRLGAGDDLPATPHRRDENGSPDGPSPLDQAFGRRA